MLIHALFCSLTLLTDTAYCLLGLLTSYGQTISPTASCHWKSVPSRSSSHTAYVAELCGAKRRGPKPRPLSAAVKLRTERRKIRNSNLSHLCLFLPPPLHPPPPHRSFNALYHHHPMPGPGVHVGLYPFQNSNFILNEQYSAKRGRLGCVNSPPWREEQRCGITQPIRRLLAKYCK